MITALIKIGTFLVEHADLLELAYEAIVEKKVPKDALIASIKQVMTEASDAEMRRELP